MNVCFVETEGELNGLADIEMEGTNDKLGRFEGITEVLRVVEGTIDDDGFDDGINVASAETEGAPNGFCETEGD